MGKANSEAQLSECYPQQIKSSPLRVPPVTEIKVLELHFLNRNLREVSFAASLILSLGPQSLKKSTLWPFSKSFDP